MLPVISGKVHNLSQKNHKYMWYQDDIYLDYHRLVGPLQFGTTGRKKLSGRNCINNDRRRNKHFMYKIIFEIGAVIVSVFVLLYFHIVHLNEKKGLI